MGPKTKRLAGTSLVEQAAAFHFRYCFGHRPLVVAVIQCEVHKIGCGGQVGAVQERQQSHRPEHILFLTAAQRRAGQQRIHQTPVNMRIARVYRPQKVLPDILKEVVDAVEIRR